MVLCDIFSQTNANFSTLATTEPQAKSKNYQIISPSRDSVGELFQEKLITPRQFHRDILLTHIWSPMGLSLRYCDNP